MSTLLSFCALAAICSLSLCAATISFEGVGGRYYSNLSVVLPSQRQTMRIGGTLNTDSGAVILSSFRMEIVVDEFATPVEFRLFESSFSTPPQDILNDPLQYGVLSIHIGSYSASYGRFSTSVNLLSANGGFNPRDYPDVYGLVFPFVNGGTQFYANTELGFGDSREFREFGGFGSVQVQSSSDQASSSPEPATYLITSCGISLLVVLKRHYAKAV